MICSIHQPNYIPYIWLFHKIKQSDIFVFYDTAQYTKGDYHNRNTIKWSNGGILLSLPVNVRLGQSIKETTFDSRILQKHLKTIKESYKKAQFFKENEAFLEEIYSYDKNNLSEFNIHTIIQISKRLWLQTKFLVLSELIENLTSQSTDALVDVCNLVGADKYISWAGWRSYIEENKFENALIKLHYQDFHHPTYTQLWGDFIPYMSVLDLLLNEGVDRSYEIIGG